jgi:hypothetical protein
MCFRSHVYDSSYDNVYSTKQGWTIFWMCLSVCIVLFFTSKPLLADVELEPNNDIVSANSFINGQTIYGQLSSDSDVDWFHFNGKNIPEEIPLAFQCNQAGDFYYYYNPYFYTVSAYNSGGTLISSYKIPLSLCTSYGGNSYTMHLNGSPAGATSVSIAAIQDATTCPYCYYSTFPNYTSEYSLHIVRPGTTGSTPTLTTKVGRVVKGSEIKKDLRRHADSVNIALKGCKDDKVNASILIKGIRLKLSDITPQTNIAIEIGNWRCDATGTWGSSLYPTGTEFKATKPK